MLMSLESSVQCNGIHTANSVLINQTSWSQLILIHAFTLIQHAHTRHSFELAYIAVALPYGVLSLLSNVWAGYHPP